MLTARLNPVMGPKGKQPRSRPVEVAGEPAVDAGFSNNTPDSISAPLSARAGAQDPINSQASGTVGSGTAEGVEGANSVNTTNPPQARPGSCRSRVREGAAIRFRGVGPAPLMARPVTPLAERLLGVYEFRIMGIVSWMRRGPSRKIGHPERLFVPLAGVIWVLCGRRLSVQARTHSPQLREALAQVKPRRSELRPPHPLTPRVRSNPCVRPHRLARLFATLIRTRLLGESRRRRHPPMRPPTRTCRLKRPKGASPKSQSPRDRCPRIRAR